MGLQKTAQSFPRLNIIRTMKEDLSPDEMLELILQDRGCSELSDFLQPAHPKDISLASLVESFEEKWARTMDILKELHKSKEMIVVYTDYDADGVTGGSIMWEGLHKLGFNVMPYIPDRKTEGYGFSKAGIDSVIAELNPKLIISVDHGIVGHEFIDYARQRQVPVIVTDHHQKQKGEPDSALAVFHTDKLSGSGVAYFFIQHLYKEFGRPVSDDYMALAAIGTVADLIPVVGPSRSLVLHGLKALGQTPRLGLRHLMREAGIPEGQPLDTYHIGFMIAPRINAFGRLEHAIDALRLLCTTSYDKAIQLSSKATDINKQRQSIVEEAVKEALADARGSNKVIILTSQTWDEGIIGLIAGKVLQTHYKPTIVITESNGHSKASVRSVPGVDIMRFLTGLSDYFIDMGGHKAAAGFTIATDKVEHFKLAAEEKAQAEISDEMLEHIVAIDASVDLKSLNFSFAQALRRLEPFGMGNQKPLFLFEAVLQDAQPLGKTGRHSKLLLRSNDTMLEGVFFNTPPSKLPSRNSNVRVVSELDVKEWQGRLSHQAMVKYIEG